MSYKICGHARPFAARCIECELISAREGLAWAKDSFDKHSKLIAKLEAEKKLSEQAIGMIAAGQSPST